MEETACGFENMRRFCLPRLVPCGFWQSNGSLQCNNRVNYSRFRKFSDCQPAERREDTLLLPEDVDNSTKGLNQEKCFGFASMDINQLSNKIIGAAIEVHKAIGPGLLESAYEECLCHELNLRGIFYEKYFPSATFAPRR